MVRTQLSDAQIQGLVNSFAQTAAKQGISANQAAYNSAAQMGLSGTAIDELYGMTPGTADSWVSSSGNAALSGNPFDWNVANGGQGVAASQSSPMDIDTYLAGKTASGARESIPAIANPEAAGVSYKMGNYYNSNGVISDSEGKALGSQTMPTYTGGFSDTGDGGWTQPGMSNPIYPATTNVSNVGGERAYDPAFPDYTLESKGTYVPSGGGSGTSESPSPTVVLAAPAQTTSMAFRNSYGDGANRVIDYRQPQYDAAYTQADWNIWDAPIGQTGPNASSANFQPGTTGVSAGAASGSNAGTFGSWGSVGDGGWSLPFSGYKQAYAGGSKAPSQDYQNPWN